MVGISFILVCLVVGMKCNTYETLEPGTVYNIESKKCKKGKYPKNEYCSWNFSLELCTPIVHCDYIDIKGKGKRLKQKCCKSVHGIISSCVKMSWRQVEHEYHVLGEGPMRQEERLNDLPR